MESDHMSPERNFKPNTQTNDTRVSTRGVDHKMRSNISTRIVGHAPPNKGGNPLEKHNSKGTNTSKVIQGLQI